MTQQLTDGVRLLQNQVHNQNGTLELCHTSCLLYDGGSLASYLTKGALVRCIHPGVPCQEMSRTSGGPNPYIEPYSENLR